MVNKSGRYLMEAVTRRLSVLACSLMLVGALAGPSQAIPIVGGIGFGGAWQPQDSSGNATTIAAATQVHVLNSNTVSVNSVSGDFATFVSVFQTATYNDFIFNPSTATPGLWSVGGFTFDLTSSTIMTQTSAGLILNGTGTVSGNGFTPTTGIWSFSGDQTGQTFSFSSTTSTQTPEPATLSLLGLGLAGLGLTWRLRKAG
jgi:hypothetical protein